MIRNSPQQPAQGVNRTACRHVKASKPVTRIPAGHRLSVGEEGFEPSHPRIFPDLVLEYADWGEIPCSGSSCEDCSGHAPARVNRVQPTASI
jgi:hypothetical protein